MPRPQKVKKGGTTLFRVQIRRPRAGYMVDEYFDTEAKANSFIESAAEDMAAGRPVRKAAAGHKTFQEAVEIYLSDKKALVNRKGRPLKDSFIKNRAIRLKFLARKPNTGARLKIDQTGGNLGQIRLDKIKSGVLQEALDGLESDLDWSKANRYRYESVLSVFFDYCSDEKRRWMADNPVSWKRYNPDNRRRRVISDEEWVKLLDAADDLDAESRIGMLGFYLRLARITGLRKSELLQLRWADIQEVQDRGESIAASLYVADSKSHEPRTVFIDHDTLKLLHAHEQNHRRSGSNKVFPSENRAMQYLYDPTKPFQRARDKAGLDAPDETHGEKLTIHSIRHSWTTEMANAEGQSLAGLMSAAGWKTVKTADHYIHSDEKQSAKATRLMMEERKRKR